MITLYIFKLKMRLLDRTGTHYEFGAMLHSCQIPVGLHHFILPSAMHECLDKNNCCQAFEYLTIHSWENGLIYFIV